MNLRHLLLPLLAVLFVTGCIREDLSDCPPALEDNVKIYFRYLGDGTTDILYQKMSRVDLYVFDEEGNNLSRIRYDHEQLASFSDMPSFKLSRGKYRVVAVGNPLDYTEVIGNRKPETTLDSVYIQSPRYADEGNHVTRQDNNYMGGTDLEVTDEGKMLFDTLTMRSSHVNVQIDLKGIEPAATRGGGNVIFDGNPYTLRIEDSNMETDFNNRVRTNARGNVYPEFRYDEERKCYTSVNLALYRMNDPSFKGEIWDDPWCKHRLVIYKDGQEIYSISAADYLEKYADIIDGTRQEAFIPVEVELIGGTVTVKVPDWVIEDSTPDYE